MIHRIVSYEGLTEPRRSEQALKDLEDFISPKRFQTMIAYAKVKDRDWMTNAFSIMLEVEGFPVEAFLAKYPPQNPKGEG
jgi:hypothetical protein